MPAAMPTRQVRADALTRYTATAVVVIVGALMLPFGAVAVASPSKAKAGRVTFGVAPANAHHANGLPHFDISATPGARLRDDVAVLNYSSVPLTLQLYATDALNTANGGFTLLAAGAKPRQVGAWISLPKRSSTVRVPAETKDGPGQFVVPFTLQVPTTASPGDHVGGIVASLRTVGHNSTGQNVILDQRAATRFFVRIAGALKPGVTVMDVHGSYHGTINPIGRGRVSVNYLVRNTGNLEVGIRQAVSVKGLFGSRRSVTVPTLSLLLPGDSVRESAQVPGVWPELLGKVKVTAQPIAAPGDIDPKLLPVTASTTVWTIPWTLIALIVLVVALIVAAIRQRRHRSNRPTPAVAGKVAA